MKKVVLDAGHGYNTPGKRSPADEREWTFNSEVLKACDAKLRTYGGVEILRVDDPSGKTDVPLRTRTNKANSWGADIYVSIHHNANTARWGNWGGVETYTMAHVNANPKSVVLAGAVHRRIVKAMGLRDRGVKKMNLHVLRETRMPAILTEGGFMDSLTDIGVLRSHEKMKAQGEAIAEGIAEFLGLKGGASTSAGTPVTPPVKKPSPAIPVPPVTPPKNRIALRYGMVGDDVRLMQTRLAKVYFYPEKAKANRGVDGSFGRATEDAVKRFQSVYTPREVDGIFGPNTRRELDKVLKG